jgi:hypothetical protein
LNNGNVGIGTTTPSVKLHVYESALDKSGVLINIATTSASYYSLNVQSAGTSRLYVRADGNVGIGTTTPAYKLDVNGDINVSGVYRKGGTAGVSVSCGSGQTPSGITISGGIVTSAGSCISIGGGGAPTDASYVVLGLHGTLTAERVLTAGTGINITDTGPNGNVYISVNTDVVPLKEGFIYGDYLAKFTTTGGNLTSSIIYGGSSHIGVSGAVSIGKVAAPVSGRALEVYNVGTSTVRISSGLYDTGGRKAILELSSEVATRTEGILIIEQGNEKWFFGQIGGSFTIGFPTGSYPPDHWSSSKLYIKTDGNVGIGTVSPSYKLDVAGSAHASSFPVSSDIRFKKNLEKLENVLPRLNNVSVYKFDWNELYQRLGRSDGMRHIGVIAQEIEKEFPELVSEWEQDGVKYKAVDYSRLSAVLLEAIKEQQKEIEELKSEIQLLKAMLGTK